MANYSKLKVIWRNNLNNIYKENTIIGVGQEAVINMDENGISTIYVNFKVNNDFFTDLVEINGNVIQVPFKTDVLKEGTHQLEIVAYLKNGDVVPSPTFSYYVEKSLENTNNIEADTYYPVLIELLEKVEEWNERVVYQEKQRMANENERKSNEINRQSNESSRQQYETQRRVEEDERLTDEQVRVNAENIRIANENERLRKEIERQNAEELRQIAYNSSLYARMDEAESQLAQNTKNIDNAIYFVTPEMFGYVHGEDSTEALNEAISYCRTNGAKLICKDITLFSDIDFRRVKLEITGTLNLQTFKCKLGNNSATPIAPDQYVNDVIQDTNNYQLKILGSKGQHITINRATHLKFELSPLATENSMAYSTFDLSYVSNILVGNSSPEDTGTLWFNENVINLRRCGLFKMTGTYGHNNNIINGGCFEGSACIELEQGINNIFRDIRFEGSPSIICHETTSHNYFFNTWTSSARRPSVSLTNNGYDNKVIYNQLEPRFSTYEIDTADYSDGHFMINYDSETDMITTNAWANYFISPIMPYVCGTTMYTESIGSTLGRIGFIVYDENFNDITSEIPRDTTDGWGIVSGAGAIYPGQTLPQTNGWQTSTLELRRKFDDRVKYMAFIIYAPARLSFKRVRVLITYGQDMYYV